MLEIEGLDNGNAETVLNYLSLMLDSSNEAYLTSNNLPPFISEKQLSEALSWLVVKYTNEDIGAGQFATSFNIRDIQWRVTITKNYVVGSKWSITAVILGSIPALNDLIADERINLDASNYLLHALKKGANVYITGKTASGKTQLTRALLQQVLLSDKERRTITIENYDEIKLHHFGNNVVSLTGARTHQNLIPQALRMRPDVIVVEDIDSHGKHQHAIEAVIQSDIQMVVTSHLSRIASLHEQAYEFDLVVTVDQGRVISIQEPTRGYTKGLTLLWGIDEETQKLINYSDASRRLRRKLGLDVDLASYINNVDPINRSSQLNTLTSISPEEADEMLEYLYKLEQFFKRFSSKDK